MYSEFVFKTKRKKEGLNSRNLKQAVDVPHCKRLKAMFLLHFPKPPCERRIVPAIGH